MNAAAREDASAGVGGLEPGLSATACACEDRTAPSQAVEPAASAISCGSPASASAPRQVPPVAREVEAGTHRREDLTERAPAEPLLRRGTDPHRRPHVALPLALGVVPSVPAQHRQAHHPPTDGHRAHLGDSTSHREVIHVYGQTGSNQKSTVRCSVIRPALLDGAPAPQPETASAQPRSTVRAAFSCWASVGNVGVPSTVGSFSAAALSRVPFSSMASMRTGRA